MQLECDVFISYRRQDNKDAAAILYQYLTQKGYVTFYDQACMETGSFPNQLRENIEHCTFFLLLLSPTTFCDVNAAQYDGYIFIQEILTAVNSGKRILPIYIGDATQIQAHIELAHNRLALAFSKFYSAISANNAECVFCATLNDASLSSIDAKLRAIPQALQTKLANGYLMKNALDSALKQNVRAVLGDVALDALHVSRRLARTRKNNDSAKNRNIDDAIHTEYYSVDDILQRNEDAVIIGQSGVGKSVFTRSIMLKLISNEELRQFKPQASFPLYVNLKEYANWQKADDYTANQRLLRYCADKTEISADELLIITHNMPLVCCYDGMDEVESALPNLLATIDEFAHLCKKGVKNIFTSRPIKLLEGESSISICEKQGEKYELKEFDQQQKQELIDKFFANAHTAYTKESFVRKLNEKEEKSQSIAAVTNNPLLLSMLLRIYADSGELPRSIAEIYEKSVALLLIEREQEKVSVSSFIKEHFLQLLQRLAYCPYDNEFNQVSQDRWQAQTQEQMCHYIKRIMGQYGDDEEARRNKDEFFRYLSQRGLYANGTLKLHQSFQEYLAASYLYYACYNSSCGKISTFDDECDTESVFKTVNGKSRSDVVKAIAAKVHRHQGAYKLMVSLLNIVDYKSLCDKPIAETMAAFADKSMSEIYTPHASMKYDITYIWMKYLCLSAVQLCNWRNTACAELIAVMLTQSATNVMNPCSYLLYYLPVYEMYDALEAGYEKAATSLTPEQAQRAKFLCYIAQAHYNKPVSKLFVQRSWNEEITGWFASLAVREGRSRIDRKYGYFLINSNKYSLYEPTCIVIGKECTEMPLTRGRQLKNIVVANNNQHFCAIDGNLYSKDGKKFIRYASGKKDFCFVLPQQVTIISEDAFEDCISLIAVRLPDGVEEIDIHAFDHCSCLASVEIPANVKTIGLSAFRGCGSLKNITVDERNKTYHSAQNCLIDTANKSLIRGCDNSVIPDDGSVKEIFYDAFSGCTSLTHINIPSSITRINFSAFNGCSAVNSITVSAENKIYSSAGNCLIETASKRLIMGCNNSKIPDDGSVNRIFCEAFTNCSSLTAIEIPNTINRIDSYAFKECYSLSSVVIPHSVTTINRKAFDRCNTLTIYCEADCKPSGWDEEWNADNRPVVWGYKGK